MPDSFDLSRLARLEASGLTVSPDDAAAAILAAAERAAGHIAARHRDDVASRAASRLLRHWEDGKRSLAEIEPIVRITVTNLARSARSRDPARDTMSLDLGTPLSASLASPMIEPARDVELREHFAALQPALEELAAHLAKASPRVRLVESLARAGLPRRELAEQVTAAGFPATVASVTKIISRLQTRFPALRERWANRAPNGTRKARGDARAKRAAALTVYRQALARAPEIVKSVHRVRAALRRSQTALPWGEITAAVQRLLGRYVTSTVLRAAWVTFLDGLPPAARRVAP